MSPSTVNISGDTELSTMAAGAARGRSTAKTPLSSTKRKVQNPKRRHYLTPQLLSSLSSSASAAYSFLLHYDLLLLPSQSLSLESLLSSISYLLPPPPPPAPFHASSSPWFHRFLSLPPSLTDSLWGRHFRLSKPNFYLLLSAISPSFPYSLHPESCLAAALFRLAHGASYKTLARRFGFPSSSDACCAFYTVCKVINEKLGNFLDCESDMSRILVGFGWNLLPNCCGVLGVGRFSIDSELLGQNGGIFVQALMDSEGRFLDVSAGWPCTMAPETILRQTKLFWRVEELLNGPCYTLRDGNSIPQYFLGDSCFPLLPWLITAYVKSNEEVDSFGSSEKEFNATHSQAMELVAIAFRRLRSCWQLLSTRWKEDCLEFFPIVIVTACLLYNLLIQSSELPPPDENVAEEEALGEIPAAFQGEMDVCGQRTRDVLAQHLSRVLVKK